MGEKSNLINASNSMRLQSGLFTNKWLALIIVCQYYSLLLCLNKYLKITFLFA